MTAPDAAGPSPLCGGELSPSVATIPSPHAALVASSSGAGSLGSQTELSAVLADLAARDPDVLLAVDEVDRSLIRLTLELAPLERVRSSAASAATLARFRRVGG